MHTSKPHLWLRAETRANEARYPLSPRGAAQMMAQGWHVTVEHSDQRCIPLSAYDGAALAPLGGWREAPADAVILGLKELPKDTGPLCHRHIMFGHAYKDQPDAPDLLRRFQDGGGSLLDLEYLTDPSGRRQVAFGHWAGFAGALVSVQAWAAQHSGTPCPHQTQRVDADAMITETARLMDALPHALPRPRVIVIGALGRVGRGAAAACAALDLPVTGWDMAETAHGGPFPAIQDHDIFLNCILAAPDTPVFVPPTMRDAPDRHLRVVGDIACDPGSPYSPVPLYDDATTWAAPVVRVAHTPALDIMAIDNLPAMLPADSSAEFSEGLLPLLMDLEHDTSGVWARAMEHFNTACATRP
ncbi:MAG: saccharopine dehydrogenase [Primorskyibacter sp.]